jgi:hypothetical protein
MTEKFATREIAETVPVIKMAMTEYRNIHIIHTDTHNSGIPQKKIALPCIKKDPFAIIFNKIG